jgi:hypothetical protein
MDTKALLAKIEPLLHRAAAAGCGGAGWPQEPPALAETYTAVRRELETLHAIEEELAASRTALATARRRVQAMLERISDAFFALTNASLVILLVKDNPADVRC